MMCPQAPSHNGKLPRFEPKRVIHYFWPRKKSPVAIFHVLQCESFSYRPLTDMRDGVGKTPQILVLNLEQF
jgi:hypothetical protein